MPNLKTYVQLGRLGDILNILPLMWADAQNGKRNRLMVSKDYAHVLDGVSYVEPLVFDGPHFDLATACESLAGNGAEFVCTQVNGPKDMVSKYTYAPANMQNALTTSHSKESWRVAGRLDEWDKVYPLVFDQRDHEREKALYETYVERKKNKFIIVASQGFSSPFPYRPLLHELLRHSGFNVVDLSRVTGTRFYDLLGLYERAACLVAIDSAPLHLARACPDLPVVALANDKPALWNGSPWQQNYIFYCRYQDFPFRAVEMLEAIRNCERKGSFTRARKLYDKKCFVHIWNEYEQEFEHRAPWSEEFGDRWIATPVTPGMCGRDSLMIHDKKRMPFLKDCIRLGCQRARAGDYVMLCRPNTAPMPDLMQELQKTEAAYAYRLQGNPLRYFPVHDLFCAKKYFWVQIMDQIPSHIWGNDFYWSNTLWIIFKEHGAIDVTGYVKRIGESAKKEPEDKIPPRLDHNQKIDATIVSAHKIFCRFPKISLQKQTKIVRTRFGCGYNPGMALLGETLYFAYRYHAGPTLQSQIAMGVFDKDLQLYEERHLPLPGKSREDPKLFVHNGKLHISWVDATWPDQPFRSIVRYAPLIEGNPGMEVTLPIGQNDWSSMEKNWVFFSHEGELYCIYRIAPEQMIYRISAAEPPQLIPPVSGPDWPYGEVRGGTVPIPYRAGQLIRFFHSSMDNEFDKQPRRYFVGAYTMEDKPPFKPISITRQPVLYGSEMDDIPSMERKTALQYKRKVVFPGGAVKMKDGFLLAVGINDGSCALVTIREEQITL